jgi:Fe-S cluster assembly iron-binding protein IscA
LYFDLSLDETADDKRDRIVAVDGIDFVVETRTEPYVDGLEIDVQTHYGREGLVAFNRRFGGGCG